jgi:hypothetical protein
VNQPPPEPPRQGAVAFDLTPIGRRRGRRIDPAWVILALVAVLVAAAILHPWQATHPSIALVPHPSATPTRSAVPSPVSGPSPAPQGAVADVAAADELAGNVVQLGGDAAPWGVGVGADVGPPLQPTLEIPALGVATDQAWWAWIVVKPATTQATASSVAAAIERLPVDKLCRGIPDLPTGGQVLVITTPFGTPGTIEVQAWHEVGWHDEPRDIEPLPGFGDLTPRHAGDVSYVQLAGGRAWPDGRYELTVDESSLTSLAVCLGTP